MFRPALTITLAASLLAGVSAAQAAERGEGTQQEELDQQAALRLAEIGSRLWHSWGQSLGNLELPGIDIFTSAAKRAEEILAAVDLRTKLFDAHRQLLAWSVDAARSGSLGSELAWTSIDLSVLSNEPVPGHQTSGFGWRRDPMKHIAKFHRGSDVKAKRGTVVEAAGPGVVLIATQQSGYGNVVYIDHGGGLVTRYGHLQKITVRKGEAVNAGDRIGHVGATGRATGPHLHFEVRLDGRAVNPVDALAIAKLDHTDKAQVQVAMLRLMPELQEAQQSPQDPPRSKAEKSKRGKGNGKGTRPERTGRGKRKNNVS